LALVREPEDAELLFLKLKAIDKAARLAKTHAEIRLRAGRLHLRAERRWGELLGPADHGHRESFRLQDSDYLARHRARELAAVDAIATAIAR
jgi:hypothetical protein